MAEQLQIQVGSLVFDARVAGPVDDTPVLLLHGFPETSLEWVAQIEALAQAGYRAATPDQRGYSPGARPAAVGEYHRDKLVQDVLDVADALGTARFHLVGHDWGALVAWQVATTAPDRLLTIRCISVPHPDALRKELSDPSSAQYAASAHVELCAAPNAGAKWLNRAG
jgi:pimeloyl-ACP methyl ester carboxylesterase